jgi:hypothetical protein
MHETAIFQRESSALYGHSYANNRPFYGMVTPMNGQVTFASGIQFYGNLHLCGNNRLCVCMYVCMYYVFLYTCVCVCVCMYVSLYVCVCVCVCVHMQMEHKFICMNLSSF